MDLPALLQQYVPTRDSRCALSHAQALGVLLRSIVVEREPLYRQQETVYEFAPQLYGLGGEQIQHLSDDRVGRALDRLFDADRAALLTAVVVSAGQRCGVQFDELHNDSTSVSFSGQYREAEQPIRGRLPALLTYGYSKDHRPDLKQLVLILTTSEDGGVPVHFRVADGNTNDSVTHIESWNALRAVTGRADFLYVADSKLCSSDNMDHIHRQGGRFVTVMPRTRREDKSKPIPHPGIWFGIDPIPAGATDRRTAGMCTAVSYPRPKPGPSSGCGVRCSPSSMRRAGSGASAQRWRR
jgi:Domain of unknown function (DUF4277)/Transposase DDE domain